MGTYTVKRIFELIGEIKAAKLEGRGFLEQYSASKIAEIYNGIGPDQFPDWLRKIVTETSGIFEPAAVIHDVRYHVGGTKKDFTKANEEFRRNCYRLVKREYGWWNPVRYALLNKARRWANYCEMFGLDGYNLKEPKK